MTKRPLLINNHLEGSQCLADPFAGETIFLLFACGVVAVSGSLKRNSSIGVWQILKLIALREHVGYPLYRIPDHHKWPLFARSL